MKAEHHRELDENTVLLIKFFKEKEAELLSEINKRIADNTIQAGRWSSIAETHFEQGFMALIRAATNP